MELTADARASWRDYLELCKPKVVLLMILTTVIGMFLATPGFVPWDVLVFGNLGIALCAGSAAAINHVVDQRIDAVMARTRNRPIAQGRVGSAQAIAFAVVIGALGMAMLILLVNALTAWLTFASLIGYALIYTWFLKRATPQNIVIGGLAGAAPPLLGWTAVTNDIHGYGLLLVLIIFAWTPPHFWALAIHRRDEYAKVDIPMLPVTHGNAYTALHILLYTLLLFASTILPFATGMSGPLYLLGALVLGGGFLYWAVKIMIGKDRRADGNLPLLDRLPDGAFRDHAGRSLAVPQPVVHRLPDLRSSAHGRICRPTTQHPLHRVRDRRRDRSDARPLRPAVHQPGAARSLVAPRAQCRDLRGTAADRCTEAHRSGRETLDGSAFIGAWSVVYFGFTFCPDVCPTTLTLLRQVEDGLKPAQGARLPVAFYLSSVDPARDTPAQLKPYVTHFSPNFRGLTGEFLDVHRFSTQLNTPFRKSLLPDGGYTVDHGSNLALIDPRGHFAGFVTPPFDVAKLTELLEVMRSRP